MTETQTQQTAIQDLKRQVREADNHQHSSPASWTAWIRSSKRP